MTTRIIIAVVAAFLIFQLMTWESDALALQRRDVAAAKSTAGEQIDDALQSFKDGLDNLIKNIQDNKVFQNVSASLQAFGKQVKDHGQDFVDKLQSAATTKTK